MIEYFIAGLYLVKNQYGRNESEDNESLGQCNKKQGLASDFRLLGHSAHSGGADVGNPPNANNAEIARTLGVSEPTVRDWLRIAHGTYIWRHVPAWDRSPAKQLVKHPKGFLRDSGLLHALLGIATDDAASTNDCLDTRSFSWSGTFWKNVRNRRPVSSKGFLPSSWRRKVDSASYPIIWA